MSLVLHMHPLSGFCHKVLIALYENNVPFENAMLNLGDEASTATHVARWPIGKMPVLEDTARAQMIPETSIIIEYLHQHYPGPVPMLPKEDDARLDVRLWDRFFDLYVAQPMQKIVLDRIRPEGSRDPFGLAEARRTLDTAYGIIEARMKDKTWTMGDAFTMADCAAAPALFYASMIHPFENRSALNAYFERLLARPSFKRALKDARPFFDYFPYREKMPARFLQD